MRRATEDRSMSGRGQPDAHGGAYWYIVSWEDADGATHVDSVGPFAHYHEAIRSARHEPPPMRPSRPFWIVEVAQRKAA